MLIELTPYELQLIAEMTDHYINECRDFLKNGVVLDEGKNQQIEIWFANKVRKNMAQLAILGEKILDQALKQ